MRRNDIIVETRNAELLCPGKRMPINRQMDQRVISTANCHSNNSGVRRVAFEKNARNVRNGWNGWNGWKRTKSPTSCKECDDGCFRVAQQLSANRASRTSSGDLDPHLSLFVKLSRLS